MPACHAGGHEFESRTHRKKQQIPLGTCCFLFSLEYEWSSSHAARGRDGRQEGRERGYYHLHRHLNNPLLHNYSLFINSLIQRSGVGARTPRGQTHQRFT